MPSGADPEFAREVESLFHRALDMQPEEREPFLAESCNGDERLRSAVERLLAASAKAERHPGWREPAIRNEAALTARAEPEIERYRLLERIGAGGMGVVYKAVRSDNEFSKTVAVKILQGIGGDNEMTRRFRQERQILARLEHPYIARLLDGGSTPDGLPFLVIEYVEGVPIDRYLHERGHSVDLVLDLFVKICEAVSYAHRNLIVHRDLKPGNILVTADGEPKLLDFGIAKLLDDNAERTLTGAAAMTPEFASPEQVRGEPITTASDIYSLGVVLYGLLSGRSPYRATTGAMELAVAICSEEPKPLTLPDGSAVDRDLENIVRMALRKEPSRRYSSAEQFAEDIRRYREGYPVAARPATHGYRLSRFVGRNKLAVAAVASIVVLLVGGIAATAWQARIANRRFNDVRKLANSYLFEFHDAIRDLPGSTAARQLVVKRALEYLDSLAREKGSDRELANELATAYEKVAMVQGAPGASLGDGAGALATLRKALAIRERLVAAAPSDVAAAASLGNMRQYCARLLQINGDLKGASAMATAAVALLEKHAGHAAGSKVFEDALANAYLQLGDVAGNNDFANLGDPKRALELYEKSAQVRKSLISKNPKDCQQRMELGVIYGRIANIKGALYDLNGTADAFRTAMEIDEGLVRDEPLNAVYRREVAVYSRSLSLSLIRLKDLDGAQVAGDRSAALFAQLAKEDPNNVPAREAVADSMVSQGYLLSMKKRFPEALARYREGVAIYEELVASRRGNPLLPLRVVHQLIGQTAILTRDAPLLLRSAQKQLEINEGILRSDPNNVNPQRSQGIAWYHMGKAHELLAGNAAGDPRTAELRQAKRWYERSAAMWTTLEKQGKLIPSYRPRQEETKAALLSIDKALGAR
jgi:non-specific serine/threonine protein kinase/serine/threonine-protein kinase